MAICRMSDTEPLSDVYVWRGPGGVLFTRTSVFCTGPTSVSVGEQPITKPPLSGMTFEDESEAACITRLIMLGRLGYRVPMHAIIRLLSEMFARELTFPSDEN